MWRPFSGHQSHRLHGFYSFNGDGPSNHFLWPARVRLQRKFPLVNFHFSYWLNKFADNVRITCKYDYCELSCYIPYQVPSRKRISCSAHGEVDHVHDGKVDENTRQSWWPKPERTSAQGLKTRRVKKCGLNSLLFRFRTLVQRFTASVRIARRPVGTLKSFSLLLGMLWSSVTGSSASSRATTSTRCQMLPNSSV